ncbi:hypothetical protein [Aquimarina sp. 2201CG14-23]|uniref:hypothetical protein n=1 Tax=Aquimarina mycalae TaxID=3040073 RepID=UPI0024781829|nr:hypothetical protein [Aquimarina sp. 2201CG14-23]MDH7447747.1 hypothetical protein [Aquimarina sp. 2201CG14-23]
MAKRKLFKNIANGILGSFVSRNNDVNGYWGIGKLYSLMINKNKYEVEIDLIKQTISPNKNEFNSMIQYFSNKLSSQMLQKNLKKSFLKEAKIILIGYPNNKTLSLGRTVPNKIKCSITIVDDLEKQYNLEKDIRCRKHNPKLEIKRG